MSFDDMPRIWGGCSLSLQSRLPILDLYIWRDSFWGGLSLQNFDSELSKLLYFGINLLMIAVGVVLVRWVFVVFGAPGSCGYLGHLASDVFNDSWLFPITLTLLGLGIIYLGVLWQKHEKTITAKSHTLLSMPLR
jgi:hypothetical protein